MTLDDIANDIYEELGEGIRVAIPILRSVIFLSKVIERILPILEGLYYEEQRSTGLEPRSKN